MEYRPFKRQRAYEHVVEQLKEQILTNQFHPGEKLPAEHDLSKRFHVSRAVIRQALAILSMMGLVEIRHGSGSYAAESLGRLLSTSLELNLSIEKHSSRDSIYSLIELKEIVEAKAAGLAAERATADVIGTLERILVEMEKSLDCPPAFLEADFDFHLAVANGTNNQFIESIMRAILSLLRDVSPALVAPKKHLASCLEYHRAIHWAIQSGKPREATRAVINHIKHIEKREFSTWQPKDASAEERLTPAGSLG